MKLLVNDILEGEVGIPPLVKEISSALSMDQPAQPKYVNGRKKE